MQNMAQLLNWIELAKFARWVPEAAREGLRELAEEVIESREKIEQLAEELLRYREAEKPAAEAEGQERLPLDAPPKPEPPPVEYFNESGKEEAAPAEVASFFKRKPKSKKKTKKKS